MCQPVIASISLCKLDSPEIDSELKTCAHVDFWKMTKRVWAEREVAAGVTAEPSVSPTCDT